MKRIASMLALAALAAPAAWADLEWAYQTVDDDAPSLGIDETAPRTVPGSTKSYTQEEIDDQFNPPDWFPDDHPTPPSVVVSGAGEHVRACASCHLHSGMGHPESSQLAGLPVGYVLRQMADYKSGARKDRFWMNEFGAHITEEDARAAAEYFAAIEPMDFVDVMESDTVPRNFVGPGRMRFRHPEGGTEPIGNRVLEFPEDETLVTTRHPYSGFIAYAPPGSLARGEALATTGAGGRTIQCTICHGQDLQGLGEVPRLAGLSPLYVVRQLNDFKTGDRAGASAALMLGTVANLTEEDIVALAAYLASLDP
jgi:cytochrome c553